MEPTVIVGEAVAGEASKVRKQLEGIIKNLNKSTFDIGTLLHKIKKNGWYDGHTTFQEYVSTLEIKPRKAQYLRRIAEVMETVGIEREKYEPVGVAKLREITSLNLDGTWTDPESKQPIALKDFVSGLVEKADSMTLEEVKQHVRTLKGFVGDNDLVWENFYITRSVQENVIAPAKEKARAAIGSVGTDEEGMAMDASDGACLEAWAVEFLNNPANNVLPEETN